MGERSCLLDYVIMLHTFWGVGLRKKVLAKWCLETTENPWGGISADCHCYTLQTQVAWGCPLQSTVKLSRVNFSCNYPIKYLRYGYVGLQKISCFFFPNTKLFCPTLFVYNFDTCLKFSPHVVSYSAYTHDEFKFTALETQTRHWDQKLRL